MREPLSIVCWKWPSRPGYHSTFDAQAVNVLRHMVDRHYPDPHQVVCVTDDAEGIEPGIRIVSGWNDYAELPSPHNGTKPSCYRRLRAFHPDAGAILGARFVSIDLDCVITGDLRPVWNRPESFVIYGDTNRRTLYNGSMFLLTAGAKPEVWDQFDPATSPALAKAAGNHGSDQAWISYCLGPGQPKWTQRHGVYSFQNDLVRMGQTRLPADAKLVVFHGPIDPWSADVSRYKWIAEHYR